jgi:hypothetical protein
MLTRMSDSPKRDPRERTSAEGSGEDLDAGADLGPGVLAGLPRTRPQRTSARRAASRAAETRVARTAKPRKAASRPASKRKPAVNHRPVDEPAPRQGFEAEPDSLAGSVQPPGGTELVASAAELAGELAKSGVTAGARLLKDFLSRLPG